jgi:hypothetical protein
VEKGFGRCRCLVSRGPVVQGTLDHKATGRRSAGILPPQETGETQCQIIAESLDEVYRQRQKEGLRLR